MEGSDCTLPAVAGVILAAGAASRMGCPKLLLPWKGEALIRHAVSSALEGGLQPVVVVTGAGADEMQTALAGLPVRLAHNPGWQVGQSSSVRIGVQALPAETQAVIFLLGDQPFVSAELIRALVRRYAQTRPAILAPYVGEKRSNPVLFDRSLFERLAGLQGDAGARSLFGEFPPAALPWPDERLLFDVDTAEDYDRLIGS